MGIWDFASQHLFTTIILALIAASVLGLPFRLLNRVLRSRNIVARGWPPPHVDADGDPVKPSDET